MEDENGKFPNLMVSELITSLENVIHENRISQKELYKLPPLQKTKNTMFHTVETPATDTICKHEENGNLNNFFTPEYIKMLPSFSFSKQYNRSNSTFYLQKSLSKGMLTDEKRDSESSKESFLPRLRNIGLDFAPTDEKQLTVLSSVVSGKHLISLLPEAKIKYKFRKNQISTKRFHFGASNSDSEVCETQHDPTSKPQRHLLTTGTPGEIFFKNLNDLQRKLFSGTSKESIQSTSAIKNDIRKLDTRPFRAHSSDPMCYFFPLISKNNVYVSQNLVDK